ncbi:MAG: hypothetical protein RR293_06680 [Bacteroidales bacterium]
MSAIENKPNKNWYDIIADRLPLLGHRNWIVVTDMAYPLQSKDGITTLFADEPYEKVVKAVENMIEDAPHIFAHIYRDKELEFVTEDMVPGISKLRDDISAVKATYIPHEELITLLDKASRMFNVIIIKTPLTIPYTSTFFELDCGYWDAERQKELEWRIKSL